MSDALSATNTSSAQLPDFLIGWYRRWNRPYFHRFLRPCYFSSGILGRPLL